MRVEKGVPESPPNYDDTQTIAGVIVTKTSSAGEGAHRHGAGLMDEEACADEDDEEDD